MTAKAEISTARKGDIIRFASYALRVEQEPVSEKGRVNLTGRTNRDGSPIVRRSFLAGLVVSIERA